MFFSTAAKTVGEALRYSGQTLNVIQNLSFERSPFELWNSEDTIHRLTVDLFSTAIATT